MSRQCEKKSVPGIAIPGGGLTETGRAALQAMEHPHCVSCSPDSILRLGLSFQRQGESGIVSTFACGPEFQSYPGVLHGGIVALTVDSAMVQCLFAFGIVAVTAELSIRYRVPLFTGTSAVVSAQITSMSHDLFQLTASVFQNGILKVEASGKFLARDSHEMALG